MYLLNVRQIILLQITPCLTWNYQDIFTLQNDFYFLIKWISIWYRYLLDLQAISHQNPDFEFNLKRQRRSDNPDLTSILQ